MAKKIKYDLTPSILKSRLEFLQNLEFPAPKGIYSAHLNEVENLPAAAASKYLLSNTNWGIFSKVKNELDSEKEFLINKIKSVMQPGKIDPSVVTAFDTYVNVTNLQIRLKRFLDVLNPTYDFTINTTNLYLKKEDRTIQIPYEVARIYYMNDDGINERSIKRVFGRQDYRDADEVVLKLIEKNVDVEMAKLNFNKLSNGFIPDLIVVIDSQEWVVEIKRNKSEFMDTAVTLELWSKYKVTYRL